jgi:hypothetical protein
VGKLKQKIISKDNLKIHCSIFEHITAFVTSDRPGLLPGGEILPDEDEYTDDLSVIWPPGIRDLFESQSVSFRGDEKIKKTDEIINAFRGLNSDANADSVRHLENILNFQDTLSVIDNVIKKLVEAEDLNQPLVYQVCKYLLLSTRFRGVAKFCIAILGLFNMPGDNELFKLFARHEEFTLYSITAVISRREDTALHWLDMARNVTGWGRIHLVARLAASGRKDVRDFLLKEGCRNSISEEHTALTIAEAVQLAEILKKNRIDRESFTGAGIIILGMISAMNRKSEMFARGLDMYSDSYSTVNNYLRHAETHAQTPSDYRVIDQIRYMTEPEGEFNQADFIRWGQKQCAEIHSKAVLLLNDSRWKKIARKYLETDDCQILTSAVLLADSVGLEVNNELFVKLEKQIMDVKLWKLLTRRANEKAASYLVKLAYEKIQDGSFSGAVSEIFNPISDILFCLLDMLYNHPGTGMEIITYSLQKGSIDLKLRALKVLNNTPEQFIDEKMIISLTSLAYNPDEDEMVRICAGHVANRCQYRQN